MAGDDYVEVKTVLPSGANHGSGEALNPRVFSWKLRKLGWD
jgi:hypothetical protein